MREELIESNEEIMFRNRLTFLSIKTRKRNTARRLHPRTQHAAQQPYFSSGSQGHRLAVSGSALKRQRGAGTVWVIKDEDSSERHRVRRGMCRTNMLVSMASVVPTAKWEIGKAFKGSPRANVPPIPKVGEPRAALRFMEVLQRR